MFKAIATVIVAMVVSSAASAQSFSMINMEKYDEEAKQIQHEEEFSLRGRGGHNEDGLYYNITAKFTEETELSNGVMVNASAERVFSLSDRRGFNTEDEIVIDVNKEFNLFDNALSVTPHLIYTSNFKNSDFEEDNKVAKIEFSSRSKESRLSGEIAQNLETKEIEFTFNFNKKF